MDINELESFKLSDAVKFHNNLNPKLWSKDGRLSLDAYNALMNMAKDFITELGLSNLKVEDITISGSNAAYSYTPHSDIDLHILVDLNKLPNDEVYKELFNAKKNEYNASHDLSINGIPVELYVQDSNQPHVSLGEYSLLKKEWLRLPKKRRANFDQRETRAKYYKLGELIELAIKSKDLDKINKVIDILKRYRRAGLDKHGEFGPENLAYKALRKQGVIQDLFDIKQSIHSKKLSLEDAVDEDWHPNAKPPGPEFPPTMPKGTIRVDVSDVYDWYKLGQHISNMKGLGKHDFGKGPPSTILSFGDEDLEHQYIDALNKTGLDTTDIDPKEHEPKKGIKTDPTYNVNEILDKESAAKVYWSQDNYMTGGRANQNFTLHTAAAQDKNKNILKYNFYDFPKYSLTAVEFSRAVGPWGDSFSIDNAGDQYTVFATLIKTFTEYLSEHKPKYIMFGAKEPSRAKLYQTFVNRFASKFGYKQINPDNIPKPVSSMILNSGDTPFLLARTDLVKEVLDTQPGKTNKADWYYSDPSMITLDFTASNGQPYELSFLDVGLAPEQIDPYEMLPNASDQYYDNGYFVEFEQKSKRSPWKKGKQGIEGTGAAAEVFGIVSNGILQFVKKKKATYLYFQAAEDSRIKLYSALVKRLLPRLPGWQSIGPNSQGVFMLYSPIKKVTKEASGYIPSEKEKNDPRFKTALTVDVKPDSIKKNAKAFGFKVDRTGRPPLLR